ncbi:uncharacterized protein LOC123214838 isoform X2 [Mangifera indica]|uniref:uncharacterized protein LOC123214838 isoform X2 n=1 Tax=Mangifera indica TaxID=29780 RepID=UPI001CFAD1A9|nr:uncharacterized protein LOC123214838 isoform X2 [Mangifera indica]
MTRKAYWIGLNCLIRARVYVRKKKGEGKIRRKARAGEDTGREIMVAEGCDFNTDDSSGGDSNKQSSKQFFGDPNDSPLEVEKAADKQPKLWHMLEKRGIMKIWEAELACKDWEKSWEELRNRDLEKERRQEENCKKVWESSSLSKAG